MMLFAVVPVKDLGGTKSRLEPILNASGRAGLTIYMMNNVLAALKGAGVERACVVSPDRTVLSLAEEAAEESEGPLAMVCPDATGEGTNALLLRPPDALPFLFGPGSFAGHLSTARERELQTRTCHRVQLAFDLDTAEDLSRLGGAPPGTRAGDDVESGAAEAHRPPEELRVLSVRGIPEVRPGDDLAELIVRAAGDDLLQAGDIVVVTHKVVSKAEGRLVNLASIEPSAFAKGFADRYNKDPRQIEIVLRESKRIVRMDRGIIISETQHGFVCANAGVDISNVPGEEMVCLLPADPDASARRLRESLMFRLGVELAVVVSDSFGRAWRHGITNIAIGVAGMHPLNDYRGALDPHGHPLTASVLAVADELAAAAELVMGKTAGVPVAVVKNYPYKKGPGVGHDLLMQPERDLFR